VYICRGPAARARAIYVFSFTGYLRLCSPNPGPLDSPPGYFYRGAGPPCIIYEKSVGQNQNRMGNAPAMIQKRRGQVWRAIGLKKKGLGDLFFEKFIPPPACGAGVASKPG